MNSFCVDHCTIYVVQLSQQILKDLSWVPNIVVKQCRKWIIYCKFSLPIPSSIVEPYWQDAAYLKINSRHIKTILSLVNVENGMEFIFEYMVVCFLLMPSFNIYAFFQLLDINPWLLSKGTSVNLWICMYCRTFEKY